MTTHTHEGYGIAGRFSPNNLNYEPETDSTGGEDEPMLLRNTSSAEVCACV